MNSAEYKEICGLADVLPRNILEDTKDILTKSNMSESSIVETALNEGAIEFPENHQGNAESSYHKVTCTAEEADRISEFLFEKEAESVPLSGASTSETSRLVTLVNVWHELADYVQ
jgi:hypothetical protein